LHDDDAPRTRRRLARRAPGIVGAGGGTAGQPNGEAASPPFPRAPRLDAPAVQLDELAHEGEPDPQTPFRAISRAGPLEQEIEGMGETGGAQAHAAVVDLEHAVAALGLRSNADAPSCRRVLARVAHEVGQDLIDADGVAVDPRVVSSELDEMLGLPLRGEGVDSALRAVLEVHGGAGH